MGKQNCLEGCPRFFIVTKVEAHKPKDTKQNQYFQVVIINRDFPFRSAHKNNNTRKEKNLHDNESSIISNEPFPSIRTYWPY